MSELKLLPCPFCGGRASQPASTSPSDERCGYNFVAYVECSACGVSTRTESNHDKGGWCNESIESAKARAVKKWNSRTQPEATKPAQDLGERNTQGPLLIARIKRYKEAFGCSTAEAKEACEYGRDLNSDQTAFVSPPKKDLSLARQVIQDTNDTLREQSEALVQLKAENDQLRAALASPADALVAGDRVDWREFLADACIECEIPDSKYESLCIAINAAIQAQKDGHG